MRAFGFVSGNHRVAISDYDQASTTYLPLFSRELRIALASSSDLRPCDIITSLRALRTSAGIFLADPDMNTLAPYYMSDVCDSNSASKNGGI